MSDHNNGTAGLSAQEKRALLTRLLREKAAAIRRPDAFAHRLFEAQASRTPDAVAVAAGGCTLRYEEMNRRANRVARRLQSLGVARGTLVGLCTDRSSDMVVGLLGILKAGGAYVPLDPEFPPSRLAWMLADSRVPVVVTVSATRDRMAETPAQVLNLSDDGDPAPADCDGHNVAVPLHADDLAYVIYTSGSTGRPKGVQVSHGALANFLHAMRELLGIKERDVLLAVTTLSFDIAGLEIFLPLAAGARVHLASREEAIDGPRLAALLDQTQATFMQATPATWRLLLEAGWAGRERLSILCGGESLPRELANRLRAKGACLWNLYGPTETTIWSTAHRVELGEDSVPIGRPIANTQVYVLDSRLRPVPVGVTGELYIGGYGLARGYLNRPVLTAERFLPDPFGRQPGARVYRTGDLARWRADGTLECLGRVDHQVKIRGFRIELGEIEAALLAHPAVREAVVTAREDASGEQRLVAYVVGRDGEPPAAGELAATLHESLPAYMVPSAFVALRAMPLTPNGKVDRNALPAPEESQPLTSARAMAPRGPIEEAIAGFWSELLQQKRVGIHENFFELGGHSLLAAQVFARIRETFGVEPPLRVFFDNPTVAQLGRLVEESLRAGTAVAQPPLTSYPRDADTPASFAQSRLWFLDQLEPGTAAYNMPIAVRLEGTLDIPALERALHELTARHEPLRTVFASQDGVPRQVIAPELKLDLPVEDLSVREPAEREQELFGRIQEEAQRPFDLAAGPLVRARLLRLSEDDHVVLLTLHHIIADGWSLGVLVNDVAELYDAFTHDRAPSLLDLPIQYADYAVWQRAWLAGDVLESLVAYWREQLAGIQPLELPTDRPRPPILSTRGAVRSRMLPASLLDGLRRVGRQEGATLFMTTLAAFQTLLHRYTGQDDIAVGTPIAGRTRSEFENLIGLFVNTLVLRADFTDEPTFRALLRKVKATAIQAYTHQDLPFDQLANAVDAGRGLSRSPLFRVMFVLQNAVLPSLGTEELAMTPLEADSGSSKFDLTLFLTESDEGLKASLEYSTELFEPATIDRMLGHLEVLLEGILEQPDQPVAYLPLLTDDERRQLLGQWNTPEGDDLDLSDEELELLRSELGEPAVDDRDPQVSHLSSEERTAHG